MRLLLQNNRGEEKVIAEPQTKEEAIEEIDKFLKDNNIKNHYLNVCEDDKGRLRIDYGSWSNFLYIEYMSFEEWIK